MSGMFLRRDRKPLAVSVVILKRAPIGWNLEDFDVLVDGVLSAKSPSRGAPDSPCMWASGHNDHTRRPTHGYELTREAAIGVR
jgi:hypothetical protein